MNTAIDKSIYGQIKTKGEQLAELAKMAVPVDADFAMLQQKRGGGHIKYQTCQSSGGGRRTSCCVIRIY